LKFERPNSDLPSRGPGKKVTLSPVDVSDSKLLFLPRGDPKLRNPGLVGYKVAQLNQLATHHLMTGDDRIRVAVETAPRLLSISSPSFQDSILFLLKKFFCRTARKLSMKSSRGPAPALNVAALRKIGVVDQFLAHGGAELLRNGLFVRSTTNAEDLPDFPGSDRAFTNGLPCHR